jgi:phenylpropionate dioxygenase-like ring-hydroxylating dioxygenase large terminal subunit
MITIGSDSMSVVRTVMERLPERPNQDGSASMMPPECYTSPEFFEFEEKVVFGRSWSCVGRIEQIPNPGDYLAATVAGEHLLVVRDNDGSVHAMSAVCRHRGQILARESGSAARAFVCPLHCWTYDLRGHLIGAPRIGDQSELQRLRETTRLPSVKSEVWHGFIFVNLDPDAAPLAPSLSKIEPYWDRYEDADLVAIPPVRSDTPLPWNWKVHVENFTDAYHTEFVHRKTHDFAPSTHPDGGVQFTSMGEFDNAIARSVPLLRSDGGMNADGWGEAAAFPPIETLSPEQRRRLTFVVIPPSLTLVFAPSAIAYTLVTPAAVEATYAASDRVTNGGWVLPKSTIALPDFSERAAALRTGAAKIWAQDYPVNVAMQAGRRSRFMPRCYYAPLETTLVQFNAWLLRSYRAAWASMS